MKSFFKKLAFVMALAMVVSLAAPAATTASAANEMTIAYQNGVAITELNLTEVRSSEDLKAVGAPTNWKELGVNWVSSNPAVAAVDNSGVVTAVSAGTAEIMVTCGDYTATIPVNCLADAKAYNVTIGVADEKSITEKNMEVGDTFDFNFYGVKDYGRDKVNNAPRYFCEWDSTDPAVATVDKNGVVTAVSAGKAKITLIVWNLATGTKHNVTPTWITVGTPEPTAAPVVAGITAKQTHDNDVLVTLTGLKATDYDKYDFEVYAVMEDKYEYIWQIHSINADAAANTISLAGYNEFEHEQLYVVRIVSDDDADGNNKVLYETSFTASVGPVANVEIEYASYWNNQDQWTFWGQAYTNGSDGEEIQTLLTYKLFDGKGIDVTDHYNNLAAAAGNYNIVSYEIIDEDNTVAPYVNIYETEITKRLAGSTYTATVMTFDEIIEKPLVLKAVYEDYDALLENVNTKEDIETIVVKEAPAYKVASIDNWDIVKSSDDDLRDYERLYRQWVALYDDYDQTADTPMLNHHLTMQFTDNYGNKYTTLDGDEWPYQTIDASPKFTNEGFEIHYDTRNPQVLLVGEVEDETNESVITTKKVGTAYVNVTLHNTVRDDVNSTLVCHMGSLAVVVKAERYIKAIDVANLALTTDSDPVGAPAGKLSSTPTYGQYDTRWTTGTAQIYVKDQYGDVWGSVNNSRLENTNIVITTDADVTEKTYDVVYNSWGDGADDFNKDKGRFEKKYDGAQLLAQLGTVDAKTSYVKYTVTATDLLTDREVVKSFNISLKQPTHLANKNIDHSKALSLETDNVKFTELAVDFALIEKSSNLLNVNYADGVELITTKAEFDAFVAGTKEDGSDVEVGDLFIVVYDEKNNIVKSAGEGANTLGVVEHESGLYTLNVADTHNGDSVTEFVTAGTYRVKVLQATGFKNGKTTYKTAYNKNIVVTDDRISLFLKNQEAIYRTNTWSIGQVAKEAFSYKKADGSNVEQWDETDGVLFTYDWPAGQIAGVRFRANAKADSVVVQDVFFKVYMDGNQEWNIRHAAEIVAGDADAKWVYTTGYYYVKVTVDKTVKFEGAIDATTSVKAGLDPEGNKMK